MTPGLEAPASGPGFVRYPRDTLALRRGVGASDDSVAKQGPEKAEEPNAPGLVHVGAP